VGKRHEREGGRASTDVFADLYPRLRAHQATLHETNNAQRKAAEKHLHMHVTSWRRDARKATVNPFWRPQRDCESIGLKASDKQAFRDPEKAVSIFIGAISRDRMEKAFQQ